MTKVFIDGSAGTTGLRINERLAERKDIEIIKLDESVRKDPSARKEALFAAATSATSAAVLRRPTVESITHSGNAGPSPKASATPVLLSP